MCVCNSKNERLDLVLSTYMYIYKVYLIVCKNSKVCTLRECNMERLFYYKIEIMLQWMESAVLQRGNYLLEFGE
jgi:hypothetical protein